VDYRKFDARLSEALAEQNANARYDVLIELEPDPAPEDADRLSQLGIAERRPGETVVSARLRRQDLEPLSKLAAVRQVRLKRRLRTP
jgi:hypothetical protein